MRDRWSVARVATSLALAATLAAPDLGAQAVPALAHEKYVLPNGLQVILHEDHSVPLVTVNVWYHVGSGDEERGRTGFAHLFEHIMFMGSQHVPVGMFDIWLEAAGANNNGSTNFDRTNYYEVMPSHALPLALWLEADRMGYLLPTMDKAKLDLQRDVVQNERRQNYDNAPYGRAFETILGALYPSTHPYSWPTIGSMADLSAASLEDVTGFFRTYYAPNNASIAIAGDFERDSVRSWIDRYFGAIPRGPQTPPRPTVPAVSIPRDTFLVLEDRVQLPRSYDTWHGTKAFHADEPALDMLAYVLAGDKNSRLYERLVYDRQVAQDVSAFHNSSKLDGFFQVVVTPKPGQSPAEVHRMMDEEIARVAREGITARELERGRNSMQGRMLNSMASVMTKADRLNYYNYFVGTPDYTRQDAARYERVTADDVQRVAREYLARPRVVLTVVPEGKRDMMVTEVTR
ncbi:MAG TPA: pitrilysin family protein [Gemmatimonadales bacterium]